MNTNTTQLSKTSDKSQHIPKHVLIQIENFFTFYWQENPQSSFKPKNCQKFIADLPDSTVQQIYLDYLFRDFMYMYDSYFRYKSVKNFTPVELQKNREFMVKLVQSFEPR